MISSRLMELVRCPDCGGRLGGTPPDLACGACHRRFAANAEYLVLHPGVSFAEQTKYLDEALHADARHEHVTPPLLSAKIRNDVLRSFLAPGPADTWWTWAAAAGGRSSGTPTSARTRWASTSARISRARRATARTWCSATCAACRSATASSRRRRRSTSSSTSRARRSSTCCARPRACSRPAASCSSTATCGKNSPLAGGLKQINRLARWLERRGLVDLARERLRKSDHLNPLADIPDLERMAAAAGFRIERIRYYTPLVGGFVENILVRAGEHWLARRAARRTAAAGRAVRRQRRGARGAGRREGPRRTEGPRLHRPAGGDVAHESSTCCSSAACDRVPTSPCSGGTTAEAAAHEDRLRRPRPAGARHNRRVRPRDGRRRRPGCARTRGRRADDARGRAVSGRTGPLARAGAAARPSPPPHAPHRRRPRLRRYAPGRRSSSSATTTSAAKACARPGPSARSPCSRSTRRSSTTPGRRRRCSTRRCWWSRCAAGATGSAAWPTCSSRRPPRCCPASCRASSIVELEWGADTDRFAPGAGGPVPFAKRPGTVLAVFAGAFRAVARRRPSGARHPRSSRAGAAPGRRRAHRRRPGARAREGRGRRP